MALWKQFFLVVCTSPSSSAVENAMAVSRSSEARRNLHGTREQEEQAATAHETNSPTSPTQKIPIQETDLLTPDAHEDDPPPPAYGDIYGEIRDEKDGLNTSARFTDDGRVNIRINQLNRRLSQIFTPALRQQVDSTEESDPPPPAYIPPSLGGKGGVPPPRLNVVIQVVGSHGDVQPFVSLGKVLKETYGHRIRLATHPKFQTFVQDNGLEFFSIGGDPSRLMAFMVKNPGLMSFRSLVTGDVSQRRRDVAEYIQGCWRSSYEAGDGLDLPTTDNDCDSEAEARPFVADCIIANPPSFAHIHCAEKLGIPLHIMFTMPYSPTQAFPHPLANIQSSNADPQLTNFISYAMIEVLSWQGLGDILNRFRKKCLGLDPMSRIWGPGTLHRLRIPHTYCWSPALIPKPKDWGNHIDISGFYFLSSADYTPSPELKAFLDAGPAPIYIGFGSIVVDDPDALTQVILEAAMNTGQRVLLSRGWGGMGADNMPDGVLMLGNVPHDWLFQHVSCVVHHGGAGTTSAGIAAGRPTVVVPFFGDQPFWGAMIERAGAGRSIPIKELTATGLSDAITFCLKSDSRARAKELASKIVVERGNHTGAQSFHRHLEVDGLRCMLAPSHTAVWRIKRTKVRLSAYAACTLVNANLLDYNDLKLFRSREYYPDEGPVDPVSGGFTAAMRAFNGMALGIVETPSETVKAFRMPTNSRKSSSASVPTIAGTKKASHLNDRSIAGSPLEQSQTNLSVQDSLARSGSSSKASILSSSVSDIESSLSVAEPRGQPSEADGAASIRLRRQFTSESSKHRDMMRHSVPHSDKGMGRFVRTFFQSPVEVSVGMTKGFHNFSKLWGDDTVRPHEQVTDLKSGMKAVGKEFGYGWYDGVTGLVTQPWNGARKEGATGFLKGFGKGIGGFVTKPSAGMIGVVGHSIKGVHKEMQKLLGNSVQSYITASRAAQGYEEWLQSSDADRQDVVDRWSLVQKSMKKNCDPKELEQDLQQAQRQTTMELGEAGQNRQSSRNPAQFAAIQDEQYGHTQAGIITTTSSRSSLAVSDSPSDVSLEESEVHAIARPSEKETSRRILDDDSDVLDTIQDVVSQLQRQRQKTAYHREDDESLREAMAASEVEARQQAGKDLEYERHLKRAIKQSRRDHRKGSKSGGPAGGLDEGRAEEIATAVVAGGSRGVERSPSHDPGHLAGTTRSEFEAQQRQESREKTAQEKTEEEIVLEYIKKQSLLETHHQNKGKGRAPPIEDDEDDEDLQRALKLSMKGTSA